MKPPRIRRIFRAGIRVYGGLASLPGANAALVAIALLRVAIACHPAHAQTGPGPAAARSSWADSAAIRDRARDAQVRFERVRLREMPRTLGGSGGRCDEVIGRLCIRDEGHEGWRPPPDPPEIVTARDLLLAGLDSAATRIPGDHWILGQRIRYLAEAGDFDRARLLARRCGVPERWRCDLLLGYAHYRGGEIRTAEAAFDRGLGLVPEEMRAEWLDPALLLAGDHRDWLEAADDSAAAAARLWMLADALFLAAGNDRRAAHLSRRVHAMVSEEARNPHQLRWGRDLAEVVIRYGWPAGWERSWGSGGAGSFVVTGRDQPAAVRTVPPREILRRGERDIVPWEIPEGHTRSAHLPPFLDTLAALDGQIGRFWRPNGVIVAAAWTPPPGAFADSAGVEREGAAGLFVEQDGEIALDARAAAGPDGTFRLSGRAPPAPWAVVSLEGFAPDLRRAWRRRAGMGFRLLPRNLLAISDVVLLDDAAEPATFAEMLPLLRGSTTVPGGSALSLAFEVYGLGFEEEVIEVAAWVERTRTGFLRRVVRWVGFGGPREEVAVTWEEAGPDRPRPLFRSLSIRLPALDPGSYEVAVEVRAPGRPPLAVRRGFQVEGARDANTPGNR